MTDTYTTVKNIHRQIDRQTHRQAGRQIGPNDASQFLACIVLVAISAYPISERERDRDTETHWQRHTETDRVRCYNAFGAITDNVVSLF